MEKRTDNHHYSNNDRDDRVSSTTSYVHRSPCPSQLSGRQQVVQQYGIGNHPNNPSRYNAGYWPRANFPTGPQYQQPPPPPHFQQPQSQCRPSPPLVQHYVLPPAYQQPKSQQPPAPLGFHSDYPSQIALPSGVPVPRQQIYPPIVSTLAPLSNAEDTNDVRSGNTPILVGKRRGKGRALPTGVVKKPKLEDSDMPKGTDAWSHYMNEVRKYKDQSCEDDRKNRPLVK